MNNPMAKLLARVKASPSQLKSTLSRYSYAIVLALCATVVTASGIAYSANPALDSPPSSAQPTPNIAAANNGTIADLPAPTPAPIIAAAASIAPPSPAADTSATALARPVAGAILTDYAVDTLLYSPTLHQYRTHSGIDLRGSIGELVYAARAGIVESVYKDALLGNTIEIRHADDSIARYSNLGTLEMANIGAEVSTSDAIGCIGSSAISEIAAAPHLHFELIVAGKSVEPEFA